MTSDSRKYRQPLTVQQNTPTADATTRQRTDVWSTFTTIRGKVRAASVTEDTIPDANRSVLITDEVEVRWSATAAQITEGMRILHDGRKLHVESVRDPDQRRRILIIKCIERSYER